MWRVIRIDSLERLRDESPAPSWAILSLIERMDRAGEPWWMLKAEQEYRSEPAWLSVFPERDSEALLFTEEEAFRGRWDKERELFIDEDGYAIDFDGHRTSPSEAVALLA